MKKFLNSMRLSARNFNNVSTVAVCGMLLAMKAVLGMFTIVVTPQLKIGFSFLPIAVGGMLFGPVVGGVLGAAGDILSYLIKPAGPYFPGLTISGFVGGFIYGLILYKKPATLVRSFFAKLAVTLSVSFLLDPFWLSIMYGKSFIAVFMGRVATNSILFPINVAMLYTLLKIVEKGCAFPENHRAAVIVKQTGKVGALGRLKTALRGKENKNN